MEKHFQQVGNILERISDAFLVLDNDWRFTYVNHLAAQLLGSSPEELVGRLLPEVFPSAPHEPYYPYFQKAFAEQVLLEFEEYAPQLERWLSWRVYPSPEGLAALFWDTTEPKRAAEELSAAQARSYLAFHQNPVPMAVTRLADNVLVDVNQALLRFLNYERGKIIGRRPKEVGIWPEILENERLLQTFHECGYLRDEEVVMLSGNGEQRTVLLSASTMLLDNVPCALWATIDITERKYAENVLLEREYQLAEAQRIGHIGSWSWDTLTGEVYLSDELYRIFGYVPGEIKPSVKFFWNIIHPDDAPKVSQAVSQALQDYQSFTCTYRALCPEGTRVIFSTAEVICNEQGEVIRLVGVSQDITTRHQMEQELREREADLAEAQRIGRIGSWHWDLETNAIVWSDEVYHLCGLDKAETEPSPELFYSMVHPADRDFASSVFYQAIAHGYPFSLEYRVVKPNGEELVLLTNGEAVIEDGQVRKLIGVAQDVTERRRHEMALRASEAKFRSLTESTVAAIYIHSAKGELLYVNPALCESTGYSREELLAKSIWEIIHPDYHELIRDRVARRLRGEPVSTRNEALAIISDGSIRRFIYGVAPIEYNGQPCIMGTIYDVTERRQAEADLRTSQEQLRALTARMYAAREEISARVAREIHDELGAALTGLKWDMEALGRYLADPLGQDRAQEKIRAMHALLDETVQSVRRISSELRPRMLDDLGLLAALEWQAEQFVERTGILSEWDFRMPEAALPKDRENALFRIFQEVLTNILRHAQASRVSMQLAAANGHIVLTVSDNGLGISAQQSASLHSLGLFGMRERALLLGGEFAISGAPGKGTIVTVTIPLQGESE